MMWKVKPQNFETIMLTIYHYIINWEYDHLWP